MAPTCSLSGFLWECTNPVSLLIFKVFLSTFSPKKSRMACKKPGDIFINGIFSCCPGLHCLLGNMIGVNVAWQK